MTTTKERRDKGVSTEVCNAGYVVTKGKEYCGICAAVGCFLITAFIAVHVYSTTRRTTVLVNSLGQQLRPASETPLPQNWRNILVRESGSYTRTLTSLLLLNATSNRACLTAVTNTTKLEGLPSLADGIPFFPADQLHYLTLVAYDEDGERRCAGGDYYEVDFHDLDNVRYKSRLPMTDFGNGSYGVELIVPSRFAGPFTLDIFLAFGNWHGLEPNSSVWEKRQLVSTQQLEVGLVSDLVTNDLQTLKEFQGHHRQTLTANGDHHLQSQMEHKLRQCIPEDFDRATWQGRWTRTWYNNSCAPDPWTKRFQCVPKEHSQCEEPWCFGSTDRLDSNGWHYSAHCSFKIFQPEDAWQCLDGRWFMTWGDSNFVDTIRNLLLFILNWDLPFEASLADYRLPKAYEMAFTNPHRYDQLFRVSQLWNGANNASHSGEGLRTLRYKEHQDRLRSHFNGTKWPDTVIMNSGLHDAWSTVEDFAEQADFTVGFWMELYQSLPIDRRPQLVWRSTVAPGGGSRSKRQNPNKMEMFNQIMAEKLHAVRDQMPVKFVDAFDLTFPFHYNYEFSDGPHYGRAPGVHLWPWFGEPHWYFVDIMLAHILLNALCPSS